MSNYKNSCLARFITSYFYWLLVILIVLIAIYLRFYKLAQVPAGMTWDEAAIGYNGFAVVTAHRDEWLNFMPISFQSFGDYKAPLVIYLSGLFTHFLGLNLMGVRLPFALAGVATVGGMFCLYNQLAKLTGVSAKEYRLYSLLLGLFMALSPWHVHYSRVGFESGIALMFLISGLGFTFRLLNILKRKERFSISGYFMGLVSIVLLSSS